MNKGIIKVSIELLTTTNFIEESFLQFGIKVINADNDFFSGLVTYSCYSDSFEDTIEGQLINEYLILVQEDENKIRNYQLKKK